MAQPGQSTGLLIRLSGVRIPLDPLPFGALGGVRKTGGDGASVEGAAYSDMMASLGSAETRRSYGGNLAAFMAAVPDGVFEKYAGARPRSRGIEDMCEAFVGLARANPDAAKAAVRSYVKGIKGLVEKGAMSPNTVLSYTKIKRIGHRPGQHPFTANTGGRLEGLQCTPDGSAKRRCGT